MKSGVTSAVELPEMRGRKLKPQSLAACGVQRMNARAERIRTRHSTLGITIATKGIGRES